MVRLDFTPAKQKAKYPLEVDIQKECWAWLATKPVPNRRKGSVLTLQDYAYQVPNGTQLGGGRTRRAQYMASLKAQGFRPGVSDLVLALPQAPYHGAYIELKRDPGAYAGPAAKRSAVRPEQVEWLNRMIGVGYWAALTYGALDFKSQVESYLRNESPRSLDFIPE